MYFKINPFICYWTLCNPCTFLPFTGADWNISLKNTRKLNSFPAILVNLLIRHGILQKFSLISVWLQKIVFRFPWFCIHFYLSWITCRFLFDCLLDCLWSMYHIHKNIYIANVLYCVITPSPPKSIPNEILFFSHICTRPTSNFYT